MLCDAAKKFYYDVLRIKTLSLIEFAQEMKQRFQMPERTRSLLCESDSITLTNIFATNSDKKPATCLEILISILNDIQASLSDEYRIHTILRNKLISTQVELLFATL